MPIHTSSAAKFLPMHRPATLYVLSACVVDRNWYQAAHYLIPLLIFALGIAAAEWVRLKYQRIERLHWRQLVVLSEIILLLR